MSVKDLLLHVDVSKHCLNRLAVATRLAKRFDAHLTGLFTSAPRDVGFFMTADIVPETESTMPSWWKRTGDEIRGDFEAICRDAGVAADWIEIGDDARAMLPYHARYADVTIVGQVDPDELLPRPEYALPEHVALESGRPTIVVPYAGKFAAVGTRILIAWDGSPQAARAVNDALPFLRGAEKVTILTINPDGVRRSDSDRPGLQIAVHLSRHGIEAEARELSVDDIAVDDMILSRASDESCDLIVMGAYGHRRAREIVLGGVTRGLFKHMTVPILMSH